MEWNKSQDCLFRWLSIERLMLVCPNLSTEPKRCVIVSFLFPKTHFSRLSTNGFCLSLTSLTS